MELIAYMNNGRWIMNCPKCNTPLPCWERGTICPRCHPNMMARALRPLRNGDLRPVPDIELVEQARTKARAAGEEYFPLYPKEKARIEEILRLRPDRKNMNWIPGESCDDLCQQNTDHGDPVPEEME